MQAVTVLLSVKFFSIVLVEE